MVQIIPAVDRGPSKSQRIGDALSQALIGGLGLYQQHQKKQQYSEALKGIEDVYADPNLSQEQKFLKTFSALREFPEQAKQLTSGLSKFSESPLEATQRKKLMQEMGQAQGEEDFLTRLMGGDQSRKPSETPSDMSFDMGEEPRESGTTKRASAKFDPDDSSTWTNKQINSFRSYEGKNVKGKFLAKQAQNEFDKRQESKKAKAKYQESVAPLEGAIETLDRMEKLGAGGRLGIGTKARGIFSPKTRKDAAEYERLGKSLISYSTNIPIRNRQEFEALAHDLYDPSISDDSRAGILAAMKRIIQNSIKSYALPEDEEGEQPFARAQPRKTESKERPPLTTFFR